MGVQAPTSIKTEINDISNQLSNIDNSIKQTIEQSCTDTTNANNIINIIGSSVRNTDINQQNIIKNMCALKSVFDSDVSSEVKNELAATIATHAEATGGLIGATATSTETIQNSIDNRATYIDNSQVLNSIKTCMNNLSLENIVNIVGSDVSGLGINQINDQFKECLASDVSTSDLAQKMDSKRDVQSESTSKATGGNIITSIGQAVSSIITAATAAIGIIPMIIAGVAIVFIIGLFMFGSSDNGSQVLMSAVDRMPIQQAQAG